VRKNEILLVDDDPLVLESIGIALENEGYSVSTAENGEKALDKIAKEFFDLVLSDLVMDKVDGITVLKYAKGKNPNLKVIMLTAYGSMTSTIDALKLGADDFLLKPCDTEEIFCSVKKCLEQLVLERKIQLHENILPVCCVCKKVRDDTGKEHGKGSWVPIDKYLHDKAQVDISHTYCPDCAKKVWAEMPTPVDKPD
jgi:DNA-binding NtrC family response regulator